jgi:hypothetical protein
MASQLCGIARIAAVGVFVSIRIPQLGQVMTRRGPNARKLVSVILARCAEQSGHFKPSRTLRVVTDSPH